MRGGQPRGNCAEKAREQLTSLQEKGGEEQQKGCRDVNNSSITEVSSGIGSQELEAARKTGLSAVACCSSVTIIVKESRKQEKSHSVEGS